MVAEKQHFQKLRSVCVTCGWLQEPSSMAMWVSMRIMVKGTGEMLLVSSMSGLSLRPGSPRTWPVWVRSPLSEDNKQINTDEYVYFATFLFPLEFCRTLTGLAQYEILAQVRGYSLQSLHHSLHNDLFAWAGHTRGIERVSNKYERDTSKNRLFKNGLWIQLKLTYLTNGAGVTIWTVCVKSIKQYDKGV